MTSEDQHPARHLFSAKCEESINAHIEKELYASHAYLSLSAYFDSKGLKGLAKFFNKSSMEERDHAYSLICYLVKRGGKYKPNDIRSPGLGIHTVLTAFQYSLWLEKSVYDGLLSVHSTASADPQTQDYIETFLEEQIEAQKELSDYVQQLERIGENGTGIYIFDKNFQDILSSIK